MPDSSEFLLLHTLRCVGFVTEARLANAAGWSANETAALLRRLAVRGLVTNTDGPFGGWGLTDKGRTLEQSLLIEELDGSGARNHVRGCYETFLQLNPVLLQICSDWQTRRLGGTLAINDHTDADYDTKVLTRLMSIDDAAQQVCSDLASRLSRFAVYGTRLSAALERVLAGDGAYVADNLESYHTVWFQLHEDLLTTLRLSRSDESGSAAG